MRITSLFFLPALALVAAASNVVDLDSSNFDSFIGQGKPALVEFFAPWVSVEACQ
jgi:protein disulfide-isomerase A6